MFSIVFSLIDTVFDILFAVAKKLVGWMFWTVLITAFIVMSIFIFLAYMLR